MDGDVQKALISGVERVAAWSDLLDDINVFPVADGDTGRNLTITLTPLRQWYKDPDEAIHRLLISARGNSGNIAARFFSGFLTADSLELFPGAVKSGRDQAWQAVHDPRTGTMLTVFDALVETVEKHDISNLDEYVSKAIPHLEEAVRSTPELLPKLKQAGVVDSGALGMYIFLEGFFKDLLGKAEEFQPVTEVFKGMLHISSFFHEEKDEGYCVDMVVHLGDKSEEKIQRLSEYGESVVVIPEKDFLKVHLHTDNPDEVRKKIESLGDVSQWSDDNIGEQVARFKRNDIQQCVHIMTDAAGSVTREDSHELKITLLDSYITAGNISLPETHFPPLELYRSMRAGVKVSTSQASVFERHQHYQSVLNQYERILYLCVGSVYTGNYDVVMEWKKKNDPHDRLTVIDTGAASGRLATMVIATARYSIKTNSPDSLLEFARKTVNECEEYVFLDKLQYLAAGGRLSKSSAFFGDILHMKPVISPIAEGAKKVGVVRNQKEQIEFAFSRLEQSFDKDSCPLIMLQYSDNRTWVADTVEKEIKKRYPLADVILQPLSLTSGAHMGPGTWAVAFLPEIV